MSPAYELDKIALLILFIIIFYRAIIQLNGLVWAIFIGMAYTLFFTNIGDHLFYFQLVTAAGIPLFIGVSFARSLLPNQIPIITLIAKKARGELAAPIQQYTYASTKLWAVLLIIISIESTILWFYASYEIWVLFSHLINNLFIGLCLLIEFISIKKIFKEYQHPSFRKFIFAISSNIFET